MAKKPKTLTEKDFSRDTLRAFRRNASKEKQMRADVPSYYFIIEFRADDVVCQPVGDTRYNYYIPIAEFDPNDFITPDGFSPEDARLRPKNYPEHWLPPKPLCLTAADMVSRLTPQSEQ